MMKFLSILMIPVIANAADVFEKKWTGGYWGAKVGASFIQGDVNANHVAFSSWDGQCQQKAKYTSAFMGPQLGIQKQLDSKVVIGLEGDYSYYFSQSESAQCDCDFDNTIYDQFNIENRYQFSVKGRLGYALKHNLQPFFAAGVSFANLGLSYVNEVNDNYSHQQIRPGYVLGGGLDWAFNQRLNFRLEYFYNQYNTLNLNILNIYQVSDVGGLGQLKLSSNNIRFGTNFWF